MKQVTDCTPGGDLGGFRAAAQPLKVEDSVEDIIIAIGREWNISKDSVGQKEKNQMKSSSFIPSFSTICSAPAMGWSGD